MQLVRPALQEIRVRLVLLDQQGRPERLDRSGRAENPEKKEFQDLLGTTDSREELAGLARRDRQESKEIRETQAQMAHRDPTGRPVQLEALELPEFRDRLAEQARPVPLERPVHQGHLARPVSRGLQEILELLGRLEPRVSLDQRVGPELQERVVQPVRQDPLVARGNLDLTEAMGTQVCITLCFSIKHTYMLNAVKFA